MATPRASYLTVQEVADQLKVHKVTIYRWVKEGKMPFVRLPSGDVRFNEEVLEKWLHGRSRGRKGD